MLIVKSNPDFEIYTKSYYFTPIHTQFKLSNHNLKTKKPKEKFFSFFLLNINLTKKSFLFWHRKCNRMKFLQNIELKTCTCYCVKFTLLLLAIETFFMYFIWIQIYWCKYICTYRFKHTNIKIQIKIYICIYIFIYHSKYTFNCVNIWQYYNKKQKEQDWYKKNTCRF